jgi:general stress protein YciG
LERWFLEVTPAQFFQVTRVQESNRLVEHQQRKPRNEEIEKGMVIMSTEFTGSQPHSTGDASANREQPSGSEGSDQQLTPDRPPHSDEGSEAKSKRPRGFAAMDRKLVSEIARKGGQAAHSAGTAHEFTSEEARVAGRKGGRATHARRRKVVEGQPDETTESSEAS